MQQVGEHDGDDTHEPTRQASDTAADAMTTDGRAVEGRSIGDGNAKAARAKSDQSSVGYRAARNLREDDAATGLPLLMTADDVAELLRTTRTAIYAMAARGQVPGVTRIGRRILFRTSSLLQWLDQKCASSPEE